MSLLLLLAILNIQPDTNVVGWRCTRTSQCSYGEVCLITDKNSWAGKCVKVKK